MKDYNVNNTSLFKNQDAAIEKAKQVAQRIVTRMI